MEYLVVLGDLDDRPVREHALHRLDEALPLKRAVEIVDHQEAAAIEVLAQPRGLGLVEGPASDLDGVEPRVVEDRVVGHAQHARLLADVDACETAYAEMEVILRLGIIDGPAAVAVPEPVGASGAAVAIEHPHEVELRRRLRRRATEVVPGGEQRQQGGSHGRQSPRNARQQLARRATASRRTHRRSTGLTTSAIP